jgi:hypothetical protein
MLRFKFKLPRHNSIIIGRIENTLINRSLFIIFDWVNWILEEIDERVVFVPLLDTISTHPFSPTEERM